MLCLGALAACTSQAPASPPGPVEVALPSVTATAAGGPAGTDAVCRALAAALPHEVSGLSRRAVSGDPVRTAAWGNPALTLACGSAPADPAAEQVQLGPNDRPVVTFAVDDVGAATAFTTVAFPVPVTVTVPDAYDSTLLVPLAGMIADSEPG